LAGKTATSVTLNVIPNVAYAISTSNTAPTTGWQDSPEFTDLSSGITYYFFAYYPETATHSSPASDRLAVTTKVTVTFISGSDAISGSEIEKGSAVSPPTAQTRTGYTFAGWYHEAACINAWNFAVDVVTANVTLYAKWTLNSYTVTFDSNGGSAVAPQTVDHGSIATKPVDPSKTGFTFDGWYNDATVYNFSDAVTGDLTLKAHWSENPTGVADQLQADIKLYPNPFISELHLTGAEGCVLRVISITSAPVHTQKALNPDETISLPHLPAGLYFFRLEKDGKTKTVKAAKE
jgi:uncharacterized repeat protein (TIGR02543 family)